MANCYKIGLTICAKTLSTSLIRENFKLQHLKYLLIFLKQENTETAKTEGTFLERKENVARGCSYGKQ